MSTLSIKSSVLLGSQLVASALTGYAFQKLFAFYYGAAVEKTVFDLAFSVPTMLIYLSGFGFTHAIVVSLFVRLKASGAGDLSHVFASLLNASMLLLVVLILATTAFSATVVGWLAPGLTLPQQAATRELMLWMLPLALTFGISSYLAAIAAAWNIPVGQEILLLVARVAVIGWVLLHAHAVPIRQLAAVLVLSTSLSLAVQAYLLLKATGLRYRLQLDLGDPAVQGAARQFAGFILVALTAQLSAAYGKRVATLAGADVVALLGFAMALVEPLGAIAGRILAFQVGQPLVARMAEAGTNALAATWRALWRAGGVAIAGCIALAWAAEPAVAIAFGGGEFDMHDITRTARFLRVLSVSLPAAIVLWVALYPLVGLRSQAATVVYVTGYLFQIAFIGVFFQFLSADAIAWAYSGGVWLQAGAACLILGLRKSERLAARGTVHP